MTPGALPLRHVSAPVWRIVAKTQIRTPASPALAPQGRFHHTGQIATYASLSAEGARVAIRRYLNDGQARMMVPMQLTADRVADFRGDPSASIVWQDICAAGDPSPTWTYSDAARAAGAQAMLYSSRSRPELSHVVVFQPDCLTPAGSPVAFDDC